MSKTYRKRKRGGLPPTRRSPRASRANPTTGRPQTRAATSREEEARNTTAREVEARARSLTQEYYTPPVIQGNAMDDPIIIARYSAVIPRMREKIAESPERAQVILQTLDALRRAEYEVDARSEAHARAQNIIERFRQDPAYYEMLRQEFNRPFREALINQLTLAQEMQSLLYTEEEVSAEIARQAQLRNRTQRNEEDNDMDADEEPVDIPAVDIQADCQTDMNSSGEYISGISLEELMAGQTVKLSDGHCYNKDDIVNYYRDKKQRRQPFISPFHRQPFTRQDISIVKTIIRELQNAAPEQGGYKKRKTSKKRGGKKSRK